MSQFSILVASAGLIAFGLSLLPLFAFILVSATLVRRQRPDAAAILLLGLSLELLFTVASMAAHLFLPRMLSGSGDVTAYREALAMNSIVSGLGLAAGRALVIWGVVRLATEKPAGVA